MKGFNMILCRIKKEYCDSPTEHNIIYGILDGQECFGRVDIIPLTICKDMYFTPTERIDINMIDVFDFIV